MKLKFCQLISKLCPISRAPGLKHHKTQEGIRTVVLEIKDKDDDEVEIPSIVQKKTDHWPLTIDKTRLLQTNALYQVKSSEPLGEK